MKRTILQAHLEAIEACLEARKWAADRSPLAAWDECERADWLLWWAVRTETNTKQQIVLAACACARQALRFVPTGEKRPLQAIEAAERWAKDPTEEKRKAARATADTAYAAADTAYAAAEHKTMCIAIRKLLVCPYEIA